MNKLKLLICGTLLAGLVISNAFKSDNVYKIVTPRLQIPYYTMDELIQDNFKIYSSITEFEYKYTSRRLEWNFYSKDEHTFQLYENGYRGYGSTEVMYFNEMMMSPNVIPISINVQGMFTEPIHLFEPLVQAGLINWQIRNKQDFSIEVSTLKVRFWNNQIRLISKDMHKCNRTAWILPNYFAQDISRSLSKIGHHSDVGTYAYSKPFLYLQISGLFPLSLLNHYSRISASGIIEWWPNFINRTDLGKQIDVVPPVKPNMMGHTQVIFIILGIVLLIALSSLVLELSGIIFRYMKASCVKFWALVLDFKSKFLLKLKSLKNKRLEMFRYHTTVRVKSLK